MRRIRAATWEKFINASLPVLAAGAGLAVTIWGALVLGGWILGVRPMLGWHELGVVMGPVTAAGLVLAGLALWRYARTVPTEADGPVRRDGSATVLAGLLVLLSMLKTLELLFGFELNLNTALVADRIQVPERTLASAPKTIFTLLLLGGALLLIDWETRSGWRPAQGFAIGAALIVLMALIAHAYHALWPYRMGDPFPMGISTAICLCLLCLGVLGARPSAGIMRVLTSETTGGVVARRLLPMAILVPWALGIFRLLGEQAGYYPAEFGMALFAVGSIVIFTGLVWWNSKLLYRADLERVRTERRLAVQYGGTHVLAEAHTLREAAPRLLRVICETLGWDFGALWMWDARQGKLRCDTTWSKADSPAQAFAEISRATVLAAGEGLPGHVFSQARPVWLDRVPDEMKAPRSGPAADASLRAAVAVPVRAGEEVCGVLEFFTRTLGPVDATLLQMFEALGTQVGQFIERHNAEEQLRSTSRNLERSNTDLQQFAYVASHDLLEPLRMVISYLQLLNQRHRERLNDEAREFIGYAVDGAMRMQALIHDLLAYSRVDFRGRPFERVKLEEVLDASITNLKVAMEENGAVIQRSSLPVVRGDRVQLTQLFQNLVGNAIKFHGQETPRIQVGGERKENEWVVHVRDNGIGINPKDFDRIFVIFQRLHTRQEYSGTGMGLAICKKIVERHGGKIWLESTPGQGSTFYFTLPAEKE